MVPHAQGVERPLALLVVPAPEAPGGGSGQPPDPARGAREVARWVLAALGEGFGVVLAHGADRELAAHLVRAERAADALAPQPLHEALLAAAVVVGERLARALRAELRRAGLSHQVACVPTHVLVGSTEVDATVAHVPVGPVYPRERGRELSRTLGWRGIEAAEGTWRRVVAQPEPLDVLELDPIASLVEAGHVVITAGGGGVPVRMDRRGSLAPCDAALSPERTASLLATHLDADVFAVLGDREGILLEEAGRQAPRPMSTVSATELTALVREGRVAPAQNAAALAAAEFVAEGGRLGLVASGSRLCAALAGRAGTRVTRAGDPTSRRRQIALPLGEPAPGAAAPEPSTKELTS